MEQLGNRMLGTFLQTKTSKLFDIVLSMVIISSPLIVYGFPVFIFNMRTSRLFLALIIPLLILKIAQNPNLIKRDKVFTCGILPFLIYTMASLFWMNPPFQGATLQRLGGLFEVVLVYSMLIVADLSAARFEKFIKVYLLSAILPLAIALWQLLNNFYHFSNAEVPFTNFVIAGRYSEIMVRDYLLIGGDFSRLSSSFAEPTIFGCYLCSVLLFSFSLKFEKRSYRYMFLGFQVVTAVIMVLSFAKLAIICFVFGLVVLAKENRNYLKMLVAFFVTLILIALVMYLGNMFFLTDRLLRETGHYRMLLESLNELKNINLFLGNGFGTIPGGSWHRFLISRVYESGLMGLVLVIAITIIPLLFYKLRVVLKNEILLKNVGLATVLAVLLGLHLYDYFIHLFPWIVIGMIASFYNNKKSLEV